jgi:hypothetical protein
MSCANCKKGVEAHCSIHVIPCCPGKCPGKHYVDACQICELPVRKTDDTEKHAHGVAHKICFDISVAALAEDIGFAPRPHPDKYEEVRPGVWKKK